MLSEFLYNAFIYPIKYESGHNIIDIFVYAVLFLAFVYGVYILIKKLNVKIDFKFFLSTIPFMIGGSLLRALVDNSFYPRNFFTITPGVYAVWSLLFLACFLIAFFIEKKTKFEYWKTTLIMGSVSTILVLAPKILKIRFSNILPVLGSIFLFLVLSVMIWVIIKQFNIAIFKSKLSLSAIYCQLFDGVNTSVLMSFVGGFEKHPLPRFIINITKTPFSFLITKLILVFSVVYLINKHIEDTNLKNALLIAIAIVGFAPGLRNLISYFIVSVADKIVLFTI